MTYRDGEPWGECPRCGFKKRLNTFRREWTGLRVCSSCYDPRHPQMDVRGVPDRQAVRDPAPQTTPIFLDVGDVTENDL